MAKHNMNTVTFNGQKYLIEALAPKKRSEILQALFADLVKGREGYQPNPFPSEGWYILPKEYENSEEIKLLKALAWGRWEFDVFPLGTCMGQKPKDYDSIIIRLQYIW